MTTSPRATLFRGDVAQGRRTRVPLDTRVGAGRSIRLKVAERIGAGIVVERVGRRSRMRVVACRTGVLSISRGQVEVEVEARQEMECGS